MAYPVARNQVAPLVLGLLCIVSVGMAAATLDSATAVGGSGDFEFYEPPEFGGPGPGEPGENPNPENPTDSSTGGIASAITLQYCVQFLASGLGVGLVALGFLGLVGGLFHRYGGATALLGGWTALPPVLLVYFLLTNCGGAGGGGSGGGGGPLPAPNGAAGVPTPPTWVVGLGVGVALLGGGALLYRSATEPETVVPAEDDAADDAEADLDSFAEAAGRAADRIEEHNAAVDNAVYRAWLEMTDRLGVADRDSYSPGEFADEAVALGMSEAHVSELTRLFREVRYGGRDAATREADAVAVLRTIEAEYGSAPEKADGDSA